MGSQFGRWRRYGACCATKRTWAGCSGTAPIRATTPRSGATTRLGGPGKSGRIPVPAIISEDTFEAVQKAAHDNSIFSPRRTEPDTFLLRRLVRCGHCGVKLAAHRAYRDYGMARYYLCPHHDPVRAGGQDRRCPERRIRAEELDNFVFDQVRQLLARPELLSAGEAALAAQAPVPDDELLAAQLARLERRRDGAQAERRRLADLYQAGVIEQAEMTRRAAELDARRRHLDKERDTLVARRAQLSQANNLKQRIAGFAERALAGLDSLDFSGRQQLLRLVLDDVRVQGWQVELRLRIPLDDENTHASDGAPERSRGAERAGGAAHRGVPNQQRRECQVMTVCVPQVNICEFCPNFRTEASFLPILALQRVDAEALAEDALARGWGEESARHRRLVERIDIAIAKANAS